MSSKFQYDNNEWHTVVFSRQGHKGKLLINGEDESNAESIGSTRSTNLLPPYSFGGVNPDALEDVNVNLKLEPAKFYTGCIRNIQIGGHVPEQPSQIVGVLPCSEQIEQGIFFSKGGGYIKVNINYIAQHIT